MQKIALFDETVDINLTLTYHLSIQVDELGLTYTILDSVRNKYIALKSIPFETKANSHQLPVFCERIVKSEEFLEKSYKSVKLIYHNQKAVLVPMPLFNKENMADFFAFSHEFAGNQEKLFFNRIENISSQNIFSVPTELAIKFSELFPSIVFYNQGTPLIENLMYRYKNKTGQQKVIVHLSENFFDVAVIDTPKLLLYNTFKFQDENDFIYFLMYIFEQLKLNPEKTEVVLSGKIEKNSPHHNMIKRYIHQIRFDRLNDGFSYSYTFNELAQHTFINLINLQKCA